MIRSTCSKQTNRRGHHQAQASAAMMRYVQVLGLLFIVGPAPAASLVSVQKMEAPPAMMPLKKVAIVEPGLCRLRGGGDAGGWTKSEIVIAAYLGISAIPIGISQVQDPAAGVLLEKSEHLQ